MSSTAVSTCKLLLFGRCLRAFLLSIAVQFLLLTVFLLFVNFQLLHPVHWLTNTFSLVCSLYTWFASIPLIVVVVLYGISLSQQYLAERRYCATRYRWLLQNGPRKLLFLAAHLCVGYLTAWLYAGYLHTDYRHLVYKCFGQDCLSSYHVFLLGMGITAGCYYFVSVHMRQEVSINFAIVELSRTQKMRDLLYESLLKAPVNSVVPTLCYALVFWICGSMLKHRLSHIFGVAADDRLVGLIDVATNVRLLFYAWLLTAQILSNMDIMGRFYALLLSEDLPLVVARNRAAFVNEQELTVVAGLGQMNMYVVQCLAAHYLFKESQRKDSPTRLEIFQLTEPGNRPANWRAVCDQCLSIVGSFTDDLSDSMRQLSSLKEFEPNFAAAQRDINAALLAEKMLLRHYNQLHGIRPVASSPREMAPQQWNGGAKESIRHVPNWYERISVQLELALQRIPGIVYFFAEPESGKLHFLLENALPVVWLTQALAHICVASLKEDRYGAVQDDLPAIIKALHRLKMELEKLNNTANNLRSNNITFNFLRGAARRSLYNICNSFYDYLGELTATGDELHQLQAFVHQG